jgi:hypothetical protein
MVEFIISPAKIIVILVVTTIAIIAPIFIYHKAKRYKERIKKEKKKFEEYRKKIEDIKWQKNPSRILEDLTRISKDFMSDYYGLDKSLTHSELAEKFKKEKKESFVTFFTLMSEFKYSGERISKEEAIRLVEAFEKLILIG